MVMIRKKDVVKNETCDEKSGGGKGAVNEERSEEGTESDE